MFAAGRSLVRASALHNRNNVARPELVVLCRAAPVQSGLAGRCRGLATSHSPDSTEGPQSQEKTEHARRKVESGSGSSDPRLKEVDDLIRDKFALIREDEYGMYSPHRDRTTTDGAFSKAKESDHPSSRLDGL